MTPDPITPMSNTYEIHVRAYTSVIVTADDVDSALEIASEGSDIYQPSGWEIDDYRISKKLDDERSIESAIRHSPHHSYEDRITPYK